MPIRGSSVTGMATRTAATRISVVAGRVRGAPDTPSTRGRHATRTAYGPVRVAGGVLYLNLEDLMVELKDGAIHNAGPSNKSAEAKLFDVEDVAAREFGDKRVKLVARDADGNELQIALFPEQVEGVVEDVEALREDSPVFE